MTSMPLGLLVKKWQSKVGFLRYDILCAYFVAETKSKMKKVVWEIFISINLFLFLKKLSCTIDDHAVFSPKFR